MQQTHVDALYAGGGPAFWRMWELLDVAGKEEARAAMKESAADVNRKGGAAGGAVSGRARRKNFDEELMDAVRDRDLAWADAKRVLGHGHEIFNYPPGSIKASRPRTAADAPAKEIKKLADTLSLIRWRKEPVSVHLLRFTDAEVKEIVHSLRNLVDKLRTWGEKHRETEGK
jgi:hypothetical protein